MKACVEFSDSGWMRIVVGDAKGNYADYHDIATLVLEVNGKIEMYIAVSEYGLGGGVLELETVYKVEKVT